MKLTSSQWALLAQLVTPLVPQPTGSALPPRGRGRPSQDARAVLEAVFWVMRTGAPWADLPPRYPPYQTCHRRFRAWLESGVLSECLRRLARHLEANATPGSGATFHTWQENTASLLASPLGRQVLAAGALVANPTLRTERETFQ